MNKPYIVCLSYGTWRNELWFSAPDNEETKAKWDKAVNSLVALQAMHTNSNEFMNAAVKHFEDRGFMRIQR